MARNKLKRGEVVAGVSAGVLFASMFLHWFGVELVNNSPFLFFIQGTGHGKSAWDALGYERFVISFTVIATFGTVAMRWVMAPPEVSLAADLITGLLGVVSALLILHRIIDPPDFGTKSLVTFEGFLRPPVFVGFAAAVGVAVGCMWAVLDSRPWYRTAPVQV